MLTAFLAAAFLAGAFLAAAFFAEAFLAAMFEPSLKNSYHYSSQRCCSGPGPLDGVTAGRAFFRSWLSLSLLMILSAVA